MGHTQALNLPSLEPEEDPAPAAFTGGLATGQPSVILPARVCS